METLVYPFYYKNEYVESIKEENEVLKEKLNYIQKHAGAIVGHSNIK